MQIRIEACRQYITIAAGVLASVACFCSVANAAGVGEKLPMEVIYKAPQPIVIPVTNAPGHASVEMPSAPRKAGKILCVRFRAFYALDPTVDHIGQLANYYLKMEVNGKAVDGSMPDEADRLLNRGKKVENSDGKYPWWSDNKMAIFLGHETGEMDKRCLAPREEEYYYVLNISDVGEYVWKGVDEMTLGGKPNKITFTSSRIDDSPSPMPREMRIENLEMGYLPKETVDKLSPIDIVVVPKLTGNKVSSGGFVLTVAQSGAMSIQSGAETYAIRSSYSFPGETAIGFHKFTWEPGNDSNWQTRYASSGDTKSISVKGESSTFSVVRKITPKDGKFYVTDTIENKTSDPLGMAIRNEVVSSGALPSYDAYMSGVAGTKEDEGGGANPTVFLKNEGGSLGIVAEDDVLAHQFGAIKKSNSVQFGTEHFGLEPHKSYTLAWTIYPSKDADYFGFINRIRKDWNVNFTIPGMFVCSDTDVSDFKIKYHALNPWFNCYDGVNITDDQYLDRLKREVSALKATNPDAVCMPKLETPAFGLLRNKIPGGEKIPGKKYSDSLTVELTQEQSDIVKKAAGPLWDSMMKSRKGTAVIDTHYTGFVNSPENLDDFNLNVHPELGNSWYKHMLGQVDLAMDKAGCMGVYMDSFEFGGLDGGYRVDYGQWDGHTVNLDARGRIADKFTDIALVSAPARAAIIKYAWSKGGWSVTNGHPVARELRSIPYMSTQETDWEMVPDFDGLLKLLSPEEPGMNYHMAMGHLHAPISFGIAMWRQDLFHSPPAPKNFGPDNAAEINQKYVIACFRNGSLYFATAVIPTEGPGKGEYGIMKEMFPFTPVELHEGYLIGKEKILTAISGTFYWNVSDHPQKPSQCHAFDIKGYKTTPKSFTVTRVGDQWKVDLKLQQDWMGTAAIY
jgi:hypothetical protein